MIGDQALIPRTEFERLIEIARQTADVDLHTSEDDFPTLGLMRLAEQSGSFDFWKEDGENLYSIEDGDPV
ncbi:MAG: hypothetical protein ABI977_26645 [Acidobacteriota bacterium]